MKHNSELSPEIIESVLAPLDETDPQRAEKIRRVLASPAESVGLGLTKTKKGSHIQETWRAAPGEDPDVQALQETRLLVDGVLVEDEERPRKIMPLPEAVDTDRGDEDATELKERETAEQATWHSLNPGDLEPLFVKVAGLNGFGETDNGEWHPDRVREKAELIGLNGRSSQERQIGGGHRAKKDALVHTPVGTLVDGFFLSERESVVTALMAEARFKETWGRTLQNRMTRGLQSTVPLEKLGTPRHRRTIGRDEEQSYL